MRPFHKLLSGDPGLGFRRRERDSNPRVFRPTVFKTAAFGHSAIPPLTASSAPPERADRPYVDPRVLATSSIVPLLCYPSQVMPAGTGSDSPGGCYICLRLLGKSP